MLGVRRDATADEIRDAYRAKARQLHPDRHIDAEPAAQDAAAGEMRRVNDAWHVLGHQRRRRAYDVSLEPRSTTRSYADTTLGRTPFDDDDDELVDVAPAGPWHALRAIPWVLLLGALAAIFVFTAYATSGDDDPVAPVQTTSPPQGSPAQLGDCADIVGGAAMRVSCTQPNDGQVVLVPSSQESCPTDTQRVDLTDRRVVCLAR